MSKTFPRQDIEESKKTKTLFYKPILDFADDLAKNSDFRVTKMNRMYQGYNGKTDEKSVKWLTETYGAKNKNKYIDYRFGKTKIDILHGEFLKIPLKSTVRTINSEAVVKKLEQYDLNLGAAYAKSDIQKLQEQGVDPLEGMPIEDPKDPNFKTKIKPKDRYEIIMQRIINSLVEELDMVEKIGSNFLDAEITSRMASQITVDEKNGSIDFEPFDPRDGIWFEFDKDPFMKKSFLRGRRRIMSINEVLTKIELTDNERAKVEEIRNNFETYRSNSDYGGKYSIKNGEYCLEVLHIEWDGLKRVYTKQSPKTKSQMEFSDPEDGFLDISVSADTYEEHKSSIDKKAKKNGQNIITEFTEEIYEATRIGHILDVNCRLKPFVMKDEDTGKPISSYTMCVVRAVDGDAISLQEIQENISSLANVTMYQIRRELGKMKGKVLGYDRGMLTKGSSVKKVLFRMLNDSIFDYSSAGITNMAGKDMQIRQMLQEYDLGLSTSFPQLLDLLKQLLAILDIQTGINQERVGNIQSSSTVTNAMQAIEASRTITEALFFYTHRYTEEVLMKLAETAKIVWGLHKPDKLRTILGDDDFEYIQATEDLADQKYAVFLTNGRRESELMQRIERHAEAYANAKELRFPDLVQVLMSDSLAQIKNVALSGWETVQRVREAEMNKQLVAERENNKLTSETNIEIARENREDTQAHDLDKIAAEGQKELMLEVARGKNAMVNESHKAEVNQKSNL